jgi:hypothetical protein
MFETMRNQASAAAYLGLKPTTLQDWRTRGTVQLPYVKMGSRVFYRQADLDLFLESRIYTHTGEYQPINPKPLTSDDFEVTNATS